MRVAGVLKKRRGELVDVLVDEAGSLPGKAHFEVDYCIDLCHSAAGDARHIFGDTLPATMPGQFGFTLRRPLGVVVGISPFNVPLLLSMKKICLALAAGNSFVLKPSEETPVLGLKIASVFEEAGLPPGVLNVIPGPAAALGDVLIADPRVRLVSFTGSTRVGRRIGAEAARHLKKFTLEMGGKSPLVVLADADFDYALESAAFGAFFHQGQACMAGSRIIVEDALYDRFTEAFAPRVAGLQGRQPARAGGGHRPADPRQPMRLHRRPDRGSGGAGREAPDRRHLSRPLFRADPAGRRVSGDADLRRGKLRPGYFAGPRPATPPMRWNSPIRAPTGSPPASSPTICRRRWSSRRSSMPAWSISMAAP